MTKERIKLGRAAGDHPKNKLKEMRQDLSATDEQLLLLRGRR